MADSTQPGNEDKDARRIARKRVTNSLWRAANKKRRCLAAKESYKRNRDKIIARVAAYCLANKDAVLKRKATYMARRRAEDPCFRLSQVTASRVRLALQRAGQSKKDRTMSLVGCTANELKAHLESLFSPGMSWDNRREWHIDHIIPLAKFDLTDPEQQAAAFHYTNLQPLWARDNIRKGAKTPGQQHFGFALAARIAEGMEQKPKRKRRASGRKHIDD